MAAYDNPTFTEWKDYFFNDYIIESCNNNIFERKENDLDNYDYTVKINQGEFFSFSKDQNDNNKSSRQQTINSQNNENFEIKYLTPFQSDENAVPNEEDNLLNLNHIDSNIREDIQKRGKESHVEKEEINKSEINLQNENFTDKNEFRMKKMLDIEPTEKVNNNQDTTNFFNSTLKRNLKIGVNTSNDFGNKKENRDNLTENKNLKEKEIKSDHDNNNLDENHKHFTEQNNKFIIEKNDKLEINEFNEEDLDRNADMRLKELQYKLHTLKFQNDIVLDENAKLLEILHLYKVIQSIESNEKNRKIEHHIKEEYNIKDEKNFKVDEQFQKAIKHSINPQKNELYQINQSNMVNSDITLKNKYSNSYKGAKNVKKNNIVPETSLKPKFKQFIDKSNLNLLNKKTYKQLYSNSENPVYSKMNYSHSNSKLNEINSNPNYISSELRETIHNKTNNSVWIDENNKVYVPKNFQSSDMYNNSESNKFNITSKNSVYQTGNNNLAMSISNTVNPNKNNAFIEDLKKLEMIQKSEETLDRKNSRDNFIYNTGENTHKKINLINIVDNDVKNNNNYEIKNDDDFYKNYESIMNYFNKYKEANAKVIENLIMLEENNENIQTLSKNKRKKSIQNLEEFYKKNIEPKQTGTSKDNTRYNMINSKSFSERFNFSDLSQINTTNIKLIPFHLIEKKKLLVNMMNYLYGKNLFQLKKTFS
jgi:hypothetical protein